MLNNINKIVQNTSTYATLTKSVSSTTDTKITFDLKLTPKSSTEGKTTVTVGEGVVKNKSNSKTNVDTSATIKSDTKAPTLTFTPSGTTGKATALKDKGSGYKNKVTVKITCSDSGSGVSVFKVKIGSGSYTTVSGKTYTSTQSSRGTYKYTAYCKDAAGNENTVSKSYRVLKSSANCSKCGAAKSTCTKPVYSYKNCTISAGKVSSDSCSVSGYWKPSTTCNASNIGKTYKRCVGSSADGFHWQSGTCKCTKYQSGCNATKCTKGKTCWY